MSLWRLGLLVVGTEAGAEENTVSVTLVNLMGTEEEVDVK